MSSSGDIPVTDSERLHLRAQDELPAVALGDGVPAAVSEHIRGCAHCSADLAAFQHVVGAARGTDTDGVAAFAPARQDAVWARIAAEVAPAPTTAPVTALDTARSTLTERAETRRRARGLLQRWTMVAAALVVAAGLAGWFIGHDTRSTASTGRSAQAALTAQPGTAAAARGTAVMSSSSHGFQMELRTSGLPAPDGYYEVWLYDPSANRMVAVGTLGTGGQGSFTLPAGIDTSVYRVVDVSDQLFNGDPRHQTSVLRGSLTP